MAKPGIPHMAMVETRHVDAQTIRAHVHAGDEELVVFLEEEERLVSVLTEFVRVLFAELDDLMLCETQSIAILVQRIKHVLEVGVFHHFMDGDLCLIRGDARHVEIPVFEVVIAMGRKRFRRFVDRPFAVAGADCNDFVGVEEAEDRIWFRHAAVQNFDHGLDEQIWLKRPFVGLCPIDLNARKIQHQFCQCTSLFFCHEIRHVVLLILGH